MEFIEDKEKILNAIKNDYKVIYNLSNIEKNDYMILYYAILSSLNSNVDDEVKKNILEFTKRFSNDLLNNYDGDFFNDFKNNYRNSIFTLKNDDFIKVLNLFNNDNLTLEEININNYIEASLQEKFNKDYGNNLIVHKNILESVRNGHKREVKAYLEGIKRIYNYDSLLDSVGYTEELFLKELYQTTGKAKSILKQICDRTLDKLRTNYLMDNKEITLNNIEIDRYYDKNKLVNKVINDLTYTDFVTFIVENRIIDNNYFKTNYLDKKMKVFINHGLNNVFNGKKRHINDYSKQDLRLFSILITYLYENHYLEKLVDVSDIPYTREEYKKINNKDILDIMFKLDKEIVNQNFENLNNFLSNTKILGLGSGFNKVFNDINIEMNNDIVANLLNNYDKVISYNPKNIFEYLKYAKNLGTNDTKLRMLFLNDEAYLAYILNKPPYNNVYMSNKERIDSVYELAKILFLRNEITIPAIDKDYTVNKHKYHVTIGNFNDFSQLALGELTGSCARNGSIFADDLYKYTLFDKNGFNIIIRENNKIVGKVSGFRNGNTIILNQLRDNFYPYANNLVEVIKKLSKDLVYLTRKKDPIKNVIIGNSLAMKKEKTIDLSKELSKLFNNQKRIYCDIDYTKMCVLINSSPLRFYDTKDVYVPIRDSIKVETDKDKMIMIMNHYNILKSLLKNIEPKDININNYDTSNIDELYYGHDFYVGLKNGDIVDYLLFDRRTKEALPEIAKILESKSEKVIKK